MQRVRHQRHRALTAHRRKVAATAAWPVCRTDRRAVVRSARVTSQNFLLHRNGYGGDAFHEQCAPFSRPALSGAKESPVLVSFTPWRRGLEKRGLTAGRCRINGPPRDFPSVIVSRKSRRHRSKSPPAATRIRSPCSTRQGAVRLDSRDLPGSPQARDPLAPRPRIRAPDSGTQACAGLSSYHPERHSNPQLRGGATPSHPPRAFLIHWLKVQVLHDPRSHLRLGTPTNLEVREGETAPWVIPMVPLVLWGSAMSRVGSAGI